MSEPSEHTIDEYNHLLSLLRMAAEKHGLFMHSAGIIPPFSDGTPVLIQVSFAIADEPEEVDEAQAKFDDDFADLIAGQREIDTEQKNKDLMKDLKDGEGFFGNFKDDDL